MPKVAQPAWPGLLIARTVLLLPITIVTITQYVEMQFIFSSVVFKVKHTHTHTNRGADSTLVLQGAISMQLDYTTLSVMKGGDRAAATYQGPLL